MRPITGCGSRKVVISIWVVIPGFIIVLIPGEVQKVLSTMHFMIEVFGVIDHQAEFHVLAEIDPIEVVVPNASVGRHHEEAQKLVGEDYLDPLVAVWTESLGVWGCFFVGFRPF